MLHLTNGDSAAGSLRQAGLPGDVIVWSDVLHEGPIPREHGPVWRQTRAEYLTSSGYGQSAHSDRTDSYNDTLRRIERDDAALERYSEHDELVLWFEHDLFDQLLLARHLHWLTTQGDCATRVSLICIDRFPGVDHFVGLGQLSPPDLATLFPGRQELSHEQWRVGADVWRSFTDDDPRSLEAIAARGVAGFPFMQGAIARQLEEFPGESDGLSRTERTILAALANGPRSPRDLFRAVQGQEERIFMGDWPFWGIVREMARRPAPLVTIDSRVESGPALPEGSVAIAPDGERVAAGVADAIRMRGIDRWLGGVHLTPERVWRWDARARRLATHT